MANTVDAAEYLVTIARHGTRTTVRSEVFLNYTQAYHEPDGPIEMDYFIWIIHNSERTVIVDTGYSRAGAERRGRTVVVEIEELLTRLGINPHSAPLVVITHAHYDHIGNLGLFPASRFVISHHEYDFWLKSPHAHKPLFEHSIEVDELSELRRAAESGRVDFFSGRTTVAPGIEIIEVGGHTPGQCIITVRTSEGTVLLASDAVHYYEELEADRPFITTADLVQMYDGFQYIRELLATGAIHHIVPGHDPSTLERFTPATGALTGIAATIGGTR